MPSVFISYSHDPADPTHEERVASLAASLMKDGLAVFLDQNRGDAEEKVAWEIWMENQIEKADYVLLVCTELYLKKVRQEVPPDEGRGVCWEAGIMYSLLYEEKRNTTKFLPVMFLPAHKQFIPRPLKGKQYFVLDSQSGYEHLYAFLTRQHRARFPDQSVALRTIAQKTIKPLFAPPGQDATRAQTDVAPIPDRPLPAAALEALANVLKGRDLSELHNLTLASNHNFAVEAVRTLASCCSREELETFLNEHDQQLCVEALVALDELLYRPEWLKAKGMEQKSDLLQLELG